MKTLQEFTLAGLFLLFLMVLGLFDVISALSKQVSVLSELVEEQTEAANISRESMQESEDDEWAGLELK